MLAESSRQRHQTPCEACTQFVRLQHRRAAGALLPVDVRTCTDGGDFVYQARGPSLPSTRASQELGPSTDMRAPTFPQMIADATGASELENSLRDFLLSTSA